MEIANTWRKYFIMLRDNDTLNENLAALTSSWSVYSSLGPRLALFGANPDLVVMMLSPVSKKMKIIHSIKNLGGSLTEPDNQLVGLVGMTAKAFPILISSDTIGANLDIEVPLVADIKVVQSDADFSGLDIKTKENMLSPVSKKMKIIHSIKNLGGSLTEPDNQPSTKSSPATYRLNMS